MSGEGSRAIKYGVAALLLALYAGISAWIVSGEGRSYRESYRKAMATRVGPTTIDPPAEPARRVALVPEPAPPPAPRPEPRPPAVEAGPPPGPKPVDRPKPEVPRPTPAPAPEKKAAPPPQPIDPFWGEPGQLKVFDFDRLTIDDERELGRTLNRMVLHEHPEIDNGPLPRRLADASRPYLELRTRKDLKYTLTVLDCPRMNVFSHPGGYIYVCRGLFDWISEDEDYALGFILAHEIAHVDLAHAITCLRDPEVKKFQFGTSLLFGAVVIPGGYLEKLEAEADRWAVQAMQKLGRTRYETLAFLRRLEDYAKSNGFENKSKAPNDKPEVPPLDNHIRAHPIPRDRLRDAKAIIDRVPNR